MPDGTRIETDLEMREWLQEAIEAYGQEQETEGSDAPSGTASFSDAGVLTTNEGIVIRFDDDREYQITIVQSRSGDH